MKYKWISLAVVAAMLAGAAGLKEIEINHNRYHQHKEAKPKAVCTDHGEDVFCTHLPLMDITTDGPIPEPYLYDEEGKQIIFDNGQAARNYETVPAVVKYSDNASENNHLSDDMALVERALVRVRGNTSRDFDKKGYAIAFKEEDLLTNKDVSLSGMTADNDWVLHGPFMDKTLIRNYLCYNLAGEIMEYAPNVRFCELFVNQEYMGVYLLIEKISYNENGRIKMTETDPEIPETSYIVQVDRGAEEELRELETFGTYAHLSALKGQASGQLEVVYPSRTLTEEQRESIENDFSRFEKAVFSYDYDDPKLGYRKYIDVDSFVDYFLINEFGLNYDAVGLSTYLYKDIRGKLKLCVWDFNSAFDNYTHSVVTPETFFLQNRMWYYYLFKDKAFVDEVVERYYELREEYFNEEYLTAYIDDTVEYLGPAIERNNKKWGYSFQKEYNGRAYDFLIPEERNPRSYEEAVQQMKDCIHERIEHMDANVDRLYILSHESLNKKFNHGKGTGGDAK